MRNLAAFLAHASLLLAGLSLVAVCLWQSRPEPVGGKLYVDRIGPPPGGQQEARSAEGATGTKKRGRLVYTPPRP